MELVYLWVEDYKNIHRQGFNFSPRFTCKYDEATQELTIDEKKDYVNIFPKNINVTAIVGENGSGKSSVQKLIFLLIFLKKYQNIDISNSENTKKEKALIEIFKNEKFRDKNIFLIVNTEKGRRKISFLSSMNEYEQDSIKKFKVSTAECCIKNQYDELTIDELNFFSIHFNYMIDTWYDDSYDSWTNSIYHRADGYDTPLLLEPYKGHEEDNNYIDISNMEYLNNGKIFDFYAQIKDSKHINKFFNPDSIWMMIDSNKLFNKYTKFDGFPLDATNIQIFENFINAKVQEKDLIALNKIYLAIKIISSRKEIFNDETIVQTTRDKLISITTEEGFQTFLDEFQISDILKKTNLPETQKVEACIDFHKKFSEENSDQLETYKKFLVLDQSSPQVNKLAEVFSIFEQIVPWIYIEFYDGDKSYSSLSSGEKMFLNFSINIMYQVGNIEKLESQPYKSINLFLDEVEFGLHPDWQKRFVQEVLYILQNFKSKFNILYVTHSPFILSDLPKENVIFLENGKQVNPKIETFGANIHTLLSHGFFMKDGLMGEFAKEKIEAIKDFYDENKNLKKEDTNFHDKKSDYESKKDSFQHIQSIIGEPFLKTIMGNYLDELELIFSDENDLIDKELEALEDRKKYLEKLKNAKN